MTLALASVHIKSQCYLCRKVNFFFFLVKGSTYFVLPSLEKSSFHNLEFGQKIRSYGLSENEFRYFQNFPN